MRRPRKAAPVVDRDFAEVPAPAPLEMCSSTQVDGLSVTIDGNLLTAVCHLSETVRQLAAALRPTSVTSQMTKG